MGVSAGAEKGACFRPLHNAARGVVWGVGMRGMGKRTIILLAA